MRTGISSETSLTSKRIFKDYRDSPGSILNLVRPTLHQYGTLQFFIIKITVKEWVETSVEAHIVESKFQI